jgi:transcription elongation factor Elf1
VHGDAELVRIDTGEGGNVVCHLAGAEMRLHVRLDGGENPVEVFSAFHDRIYGRLAGGGNAERMTRE